MRLRRLSAQIHGDELLSEAVRLLFESEGSAGIDALRARVRNRLTEIPDNEQGDDRTVRLAYEELERAAQLAEKGSSALRGWITDAPPSIEEQR